MWRVISRPGLGSRFTQYTLRLFARVVISPSFYTTNLDAEGPSSPAAFPRGGQPCQLRSPDEALLRGGHSRHPLHRGAPGAESSRCVGVDVYVRVCSESGGVGVRCYPTRFAVVPAAHPFDTQRQRTACVLVGICFLFWPTWHAPISCIGPLMVHGHLDSRAGSSSALNFINVSKTQPRQRAT